MSRLADRGEDVGRLARPLVGQVRVGLGDERRELQLADVPGRADGDWFRPVRSSGAGRLETSCSLMSSSRTSRSQHLRPDVLVDLQPHRRPEPAAHQLALQRLQQVLVVVRLDFQVLVPGDPEGVVVRGPPCRGNSCARCAAMTPRAARSARRSTSTKRGSSGGTFTRAKCSLPGRPGRARDREVQRQARRCKGTDAPGRRRAASGPGRCWSRNSCVTAAPAPRRPDRPSG